MTERLYYSNAYTTSFTTKLLQQTQFNEQPAAILEATCFYPTGGGQPHDLGNLNEVSVLDVQLRPEDQAVLHILEKPLEVTDIQGQIQWTRRFDHMQQHTGQHILSRAFINVLNAATTSFHLSDNSVTIDLDTADIPNADLDAVEALANQILAENRAVRAWFPTPEELADLNLRKISEKVTGAVRVVDIGGFDACACGGTHVAHTGEIGMIKVIRLEKAKKQTRVEFRCGGRALEDYRQKNALLLGLASKMTLGYWEVPEAFNRLQEENKALQKDLKTAKNQLLAYEAQGLWEIAHIAHPDRVVIAHAFEGRETADLNGMMQYFMTKPKTVALLGLAGEKGHLVFGCSEDAGVDVVPLLKEALERLGSKSGGGRPTLAQGGGFSANSEKLTTILNQLVV